MKYWQKLNKIMQKDPILKRKKGYHLSSSTNKHTMSKETEPFSEFIWKMEELSMTIVANWENGTVIAISSKKVDTLVLI